MNGRTANSEELPDVNSYLKNTLERFEDTNHRNKGEVV